jgi:hypothetical protein
MIKELKKIAEWWLWLAKNPRKETSLSFWSKNFDVYVDGKLVMPSTKEWHHLAIVANGHHAYIDELSMREGNDVPVRLEGIDPKTISEFGGLDGSIIGGISDANYKSKLKWTHNFTPPTEKYPK